MEKISDVIKTQTINAEDPYIKLMKARCDGFNNQEGTLSDYDCPICKNKGQVMEIHDGYESLIECNCMQVRRTISRIKKSGLANLIKKYTFNQFKVTSSWQKNALDISQNFLANHRGKWFYIGGQVGAGKTHLCTALVNEFIKAGNEAYYMLWRDTVVSLKSVVTDAESYEKAIRPLKEVKVLYIDDFFKTEQNKKPTTADINIAFEILNYRYNNHELITIISSEMMMKEIIDIDEAVGSRIYERARQHCINITRDIQKNYRLREEK